MGKYEKSDLEDTMGKTVMFPLSLHLTGTLDFRPSTSTGRRVSSTVASISPHMTSGGLPWRALVPSGGVETWADGREMYRSQSDTQCTLA